MWAWGALVPTNGEEDPGDSRHTGDDCRPSSICCLVSPSSPPSPSTMCIHSASMCSLQIHVDIGDNVDISRYLDTVVCKSVSMTSPIIFSCSADLLKRRSPPQTKKPFKTIHRTAKKLLRDFYCGSGQTNHLAARLKFQIYDKLFNGTIFTGTCAAPLGVVGVCLHHCTGPTLHNSWPNTSMPENACFANFPAIFCTILQCSVLKVAVIRSQLV